MEESMQSKEHISLQQNARSTRTQIKKRRLNC